MRQLFVDFKKACGSFRREVYVVYIVIRYNILIYFDIHIKLYWLIKPLKRRPARMIYYTETG